MRSDGAIPPTNLTGKHQRLLLNGFGRIGQAFARLIRERRSAHLARYGLDLELVAIASSARVWEARAFIEFSGNILQVSIKHERAMICYHINEISQ